MKILIIIKNVHDLNFFLIFELAGGYFVCEFSSRVVGTVGWN
jgi:hypothetical protein